MKPILSNIDMVREILDGRKTVTRRVVKPQPTEQEAHPKKLRSGNWYFDISDRHFGRVRAGVGPYLPPYKPGDILYVRETWQFLPCIDCPKQFTGCDKQAVDYEDSEAVSEGCYIYKADCLDPSRVCWRPSIHMPREAARLYLRVTDVRVERLQDITDEDAKKEGCTAHGGNLALDEFEEVWHRTLKPADRALYSWDANPWVWVIEFVRISKEEAYAN